MATKLTKPKVETFVGLVCLVKSASSCFVSVMPRKFVKKNVVARKLLEEIRERRVIEHVFRLDGLNLAGSRMRKMRWRGPMTPPAGVADTLDLPVDPQLVHDLAETFIAGVGDKRAKILRFVPAIRFHSVQNDAGVFAQRMHGEVSVITATLSITTPARVGPHALPVLTAASAFRLAD
jgi:hypothetical protein